MIEGRPIKTADIAELLDNLATNPLGVERDEAFRISIAGVQEKTALLRFRGRWQKPIGTTPTTHILKPQIGRLPSGIDLSYSVENEYLCLTLTRALGLPSAHVEMATFGAKRALVVERFDRFLTKDGRLLRVPQEDFCQALSVPWTTKYQSEGGPGVQQIMQVLSGSDDAGADRRRFLKTLVVFWLLCAPDGHAKNFSIFLEPGGGFRLTPLYDVVSVQASYAAGRIRPNQMKLAMAVGGSRHYRLETIAGHHFVQSAERAGLGHDIALGVIDDLLENGRDALERTLADLPSDFPSRVADAIARGFESRLGRLADERGRLR